MWRLADGQHGSDQVVQRPGQVTLGDEGNLVIGAKMVDRSSRNRAVGRQGGQRTCEELLPWAGVAGRGGVNHPAPHGAVWADQGHDDPHQLSLSLQPHFGRHITTMAPCGHVWPLTHLADCRKRDRARTQPSHERCRPRPAQRGRSAQDDTASRAACRQRTAKRKYRIFAAILNARLVPHLVQISWFWFLTVAELARKSRRRGRNDQPGIVPDLHAGFRPSASPGAGTRPLDRAFRCELPVAASARHTGSQTTGSRLAHSVVSQKSQCELCVFLGDLLWGGTSAGLKPLH